MEITFKGQLAEWLALFGASDDPEAARVLQEIAEKLGTNLAAGESNKQAIADALATTKE